MELFFYHVKSHLGCNDCRVPRRFQALVTFNFIRQRNEVSSIFDFDCPMADLSARGKVRKRFYHAACLFNDFNLMVGRTGRSTAFIAMHVLTAVIAMYVLTSQLTASAIPCKGTPRQIVELIGKNHLLADYCHR